MQISIFNGPNLNLLGTREPEIYGTDTLSDVELACRDLAATFDLNIDFRQSNSEGQLIDWIQEARTESAGIIINPAAYTHTSIGLLDALNAFDGPVIEVHISDIKKREAFRQHSYVSMRANHVIAGHGVEGYSLALHHIHKLLN